jgi:hypothetical protein
LEQTLYIQPARTWDEVWWVARAVYMTKEEGIERFGDVFKNVGLSSTKHGRRTAKIQ